MPCGCFAAPREWYGHGNDLDADQEVKGLPRDPDSTQAQTHPKVDSSLDSGKPDRPPSSFLKWAAGDFPGGAVVKNPPANAGDTGSSPGPGRSHMPRSN